MCMYVSKYIHYNFMHANLVNNHNMHIIIHMYVHRLIDDLCVLKKYVFSYTYSLVVHTYVCIRYSMFV